MRLTCSAVPWQLDVCVFMCSSESGQPEICVFTCSSAPGQPDLYIFTCSPHCVLVHPARVHTGANPDAIRLVVSARTSLAQA